MRLSREGIEDIRAYARAHFGPLAIVRLFGSCADDAARGGDLHVVAQDEARVGFKVEAAFKACPEDAVGERRVDVAVMLPGEPRGPST